MCKRTSRLIAMAVTGSPELLIVMSANATPEEVEHVVARLDEAGAHAHVTPGREATVIAAIGERDELAADWRRRVRADRRPVHGRVPGADARDGPCGRAGRRDDVARRGVQ